MPFLYRAVPLIYMKDFSGRGGSYREGARWNPPGFPVLYFATNPSLARLEMANYIPSPRLVPASFVLAEYWLEDSASVEEMSDPLPSGWDAFPYPISTQNIGREWLQSQRSVGFLVPSVVDPLMVDRCMVLNPLHKEIAQLNYVKHTAELFNPRAFNAT